MKDVFGCDKLRWGAKNRNSRRFLNGETYFVYEVYNQQASEVKYLSN